MITKITIFLAIIMLATMYFVACSFSRENQEITYPYYYSQQEAKGYSNFEVIKEGYFGGRTAVVEYYAMDYTLDGDIVTLTNYFVNHKAYFGKCFEYFEGTTTFNLGELRISPINPSPTRGNNKLEVQQ